MSDKHTVVKTILGIFYTNTLVYLILTTSDLLSKKFHYQVTLELT